MGWSRPKKVETVTSLLYKTQWLPLTDDYSKTPRFAWCYHQPWWARHTFLFTGAYLSHEPVYIGEVPETFSENYLVFCLIPCHAGGVQKSDEMDRSSSNLDGVDHIKHWTWPNGGLATWKWAKLPKTRKLQKVGQWTFAEMLTSYGW